MPETLTQRMARFKLAQAAGDIEACQRIAAEPIQPPAPRPNPRVATVATYPELAKLTQTSYSAICAELAALTERLRVTKGELGQASQARYEAERRLSQALARIAQLEAAGESSDQE